MPPGLRPEAKFCSKRCRQASSRFGLGVKRATVLPEALKVAGPGDTSPDTTAPAVATRRGSSRARIPPRRVARRPGVAPLAAAGDTSRGAAACVRGSPVSRQGWPVPGGRGGRPSRARRPPSHRVPERLGTLDVGERAAGRARPMPGRRACLLLAPSDPPHPLAPAAVCVGAAHRPRRPRAADQRDADRDRRARLRRPLPHVPGCDDGDEAAAVRRVDVRAIGRPPRRRARRPVPRLRCRHPRLGAIHPTARRQ